MWDPLRHRHAKDEESSAGDQISELSIADKAALAKESKNVENVGDESRRRLLGNEYKIQPHTNACHKPYEIGDCYNACERGYEMEFGRPGPYLQYIKSLNDSPEMQYLEKWMDITAPPTKWKWMKYYMQDRKQRAIRTKVCVMDYYNNSLESSVICTTINALRNKITDGIDGTSDSRVRLFVVEDLSRDVVEALGSSYNVPPEFFRGHIDDYLFCKPKDPWIQISKLTDTSGEFFILHYLRSRFYHDESTFIEAEVESGTWNILRRIDSYASRKNFENKIRQSKNGDSVAMLRSKVSFWVQPHQEDKPWTAILLVDPTPSHGRELWGGPAPPLFRNLGPIAPDISTDRPHVSRDLPLFDQIIRLQSTMSGDDIRTTFNEPYYLAIPTIKLVVAHWLLTIQHISATLAKMESAMEYPAPKEDPQYFEKLRSKAGLWRSNIGYYQSMIRYMASDLFENPGHPLQTGDSGSKSQTSFEALHLDIDKAESRMEEIAQRLDRLQDMARSHVSIEESRRNSGTARLTTLAAIFLPLNFATSFLSMSSDFSVHNYTFRLFFMITFVVLAGFIPWLAFINRRMLFEWTGLRKLWKAFKEEKKEESA